ncbi:MAG TPA: S1C family serine protease [Acidimicrobiales bacterium]|nr:S1C family serine protease [Acidimicrobiales bacterium]
MEELEGAAAAVVEAAAPAVVRVGGGWGRGNGVVVGAGTVLTNAHNLRGEETTVTFADGRSATATLAGVDVDGDLAVLRVDTATVPPVPWRPDDSPVRPGTPVFALAAPAGGGVRVTFGTVSATGRSFRGPAGRLVSDALEHTAPLARGSSGGPVLDAAGRLVGISTHRLGDGFYLAVSAAAGLRERVERLARGESPRRVRLGVAVAPPAAARRLRAAVGLPQRDGLLVRGVEEDSPAHRAGITRGDLITEVDGTAVTDVDGLFAALERAGETVRLKVVRGTDELDLEVGLSGPVTEGSA